MIKKHEDKLRVMAQDFLQYRYKMYLTMGKRDGDWTFYEGACAMIEAFGGEWKRTYNGNDLDDINNYHHIVWFPDKEKCERLNEDAWK